MNRVIIRVKYEARGTCYYAVSAGNKSRGGTFRVGSVSSRNEGYLKAAIYAMESSISFIPQGSAIQIVSDNSYMTKAIATGDVKNPLYVSLVEEIYELGYTHQCLLGSGYTKDIGLGNNEVHM